MLSATNQSKCQQNTLCSIQNFSIEFIKSFITGLSLILPSLSLTHTHTFCWFISYELTKSKTLNRVRDREREWNGIVVVAVADAVVDLFNKSLEYEKWNEKKN